MVRPRKCRRVNFDPKITYFKPQGISLRELDEVILTVDELEALRLSNIENLSQIDGAQNMEVHQSTFQRILSKATQKITDALVNGKAIKIQGGEIMPNGDGTGPKGLGPKTGRGLGKCSGSEKPGCESDEPKQGEGLNNGCGKGRGQGRGCRKD
jgi:uncharacterized protein